MRAGLRCLPNGHAAGVLKNKNSRRKNAGYFVVEAEAQPMRTGTKIFSSPRWISSATDLSDFEMSERA